MGTGLHQSRIENQLKRTRPGGYEGRKETRTFKKFIQRIIEAKNRDEAVEKVFYGPEGIDMAYQHEKITWKEHQMLLALIDKMAN